MLATLEEGIKGGTWFSLIDKVWREPNLRASWARVKANNGAAGCDRQSVKEFERHAVEELCKLERQIKDASYQPKPVRRVQIEKPGSKETRPLGIPAVRDRGSPVHLPPLVPSAASVVQGAVRQVLEPIFEHAFAEHSYGFRPGRGAKDALRRVEGLLHEGKHWVVDADIKGYFDHIPHDQRMAKVREHIADGRLLGLIEKFLQAGVIEEMKGWQPTKTGTPQGAVLSPLLANLYLDELDRHMAAHGHEMTRYADDFVIQCESEAEARAALAMIAEWTSRKGLSLHPEKTRSSDASQSGGGFDFLGYHFSRHKGRWKHWPRKKSEKRLKAAIKAHTTRNHWQSMKAIIAKLNPLLRGWFGYFQHSSRAVLGGTDSYVRGRLRNILRKRSGRKGRARGEDHHRWPNAYFAECGLFCLSATHAQICQSR